MGVVARCVSGVLGRERASIPVAETSDAFPEVAAGLVLGVDDSFDV